MSSLSELGPRYFKRYESPFSYRYGSDEMRYVWSEENHWLKARDLWIAVAETQMQAGLVKPEQYQDLVAHRDELDIATILQREMDRSDPRYTGHDIVAAISEYADKAPVGGPKIHQGMTSEDLLSNVEVLKIHEGFALVEKRIVNALNAFGEQIEKNRDVVCMGYTHLQAAEPIPLAYRLARYAQDFVVDLRLVRRAQEDIKGKGIKGAVGTSASFVHLLDGSGMSAMEHERRIMEKMAVEPVTIAGQTYPRKFTLLAVATLAEVGQSCHQFAGDLKILQSSPFDELAEPRGSGQVGSSAMPHKQNPPSAEKIKALSRGLPGKVVEAWTGAAEVTLERGLEDSAGKRSYLPEAFLIVDECLLGTERIVKGLQVRETSIQRKLEDFGPFVALEIILDELSKHGADRLKMHEILRVKAQQAMIAVRQRLPNPLKELVLTDEEVDYYLNPEEIGKSFYSVKGHIGDAPQRCDQFLAEMKKELSS